MSPGLVRFPALPLARLLLATLLLLWLPTARAGVVAIDQPPAQPLGESLTVLVEDKVPLSIADAMAAERAGRFVAGNAAVPVFGIDAPPAWLHLVLDNPADEPLPRQLRIGTTWIDHLDVYLVRDGIVVARWQAGDGHAALQHPTPGTGFRFTHDFAPGRTSLFVRAATADPLVLPLHVLTPDAAAAHERRIGYGYGLLYGFLLALLAYNALLYAGMRAPAHLDYSLYLGGYLLANIAWTGHGYGWLWPQAAEFQRYIILVLMMLFTCLGLRFATRFLDLATQAPRLVPVIRAYCIGGIALMALAVLGRQQGAAALLAFAFMLPFVVGLVALGLFGVVRRQDAAYYFLAAASWGLLGIAITNLAIWGLLPYNALTYHASEAGMLLEATLLALAVAHRLRVHEQARQVAEQQARIDPLTGLANQRAVRERGLALWQDARSRQQPLAVVLLDLDHFKSINDIHGHAVGDHALQRVAQLLADSCRNHDLAARWTGEAFILLLPDATLAQALGLAERIRARIANAQFQAGGQRLVLTASLGVCTRGEQDSLDALVEEAAGWLQRARRDGGDRVRGPWAAPGPVTA